MKTQTTDKEMCVIGLSKIMAKITGVTAYYVYPDNACRLFYLDQSMELGQINDELGDFVRAHTAFQSGVLDAEPEALNHHTIINQSQNSARCDSCTFDRV